MTAARLAELRADLLGWYDRNRRELPWRSVGDERPDPYFVWVSEVMLQQTRVETVRAYFERWIASFPTLEALAAASQEEVLKAWEGLGYYARARNFHAAVREVVAEYQGAVPTDITTLRSLPGVGRYTAGAVASIAFGREEPVVDGNVRRVLSRWMDVEEPREKELWRVAEQLVTGERPGDFNQALMDFGATVCKPRSPDCSACPVGGACLARTAGTVEIRPARKRSVKLPLERYGVAVVTHGDSVLLVRRPENGRLAGLWEFPGTIRGAGEPAKDAAHRAIASLVGRSPDRMEPLCTVAHAFTHVRVVYDAFLGSVTAADPATPAQAGAEWVEIPRIGDRPLPRAQQHIATALMTRVCAEGPRPIRPTNEQPERK